MRINGYRCDRCDKEHLLSVDRMLHYYGEALPPEWFVVGKGDHLLGDQPQTFCSRECLRAWLVDADEPVIDTTDPSFAQQFQGFTGTPVQEHTDS